MYVVYELFYAAHEEDWPVEFIGYCLTEEEAILACAARRNYYYEKVERL